MKAIWLNEKVELVGPSSIAGHVVVRRSQGAVIYRGSPNLVMTVSAGEITWADEEASVVVAAALLEPDFRRRLEPDLRRTWRLDEEDDDVV